MCNLFKMLLRVEEFIDSIPEDVEVYGFETRRSGSSVEVAVCVSHEVPDVVEESFGDVELRAFTIRARCSGRGEELYEWVARHGARLVLNVLATRTLEDREYALILLDTCEAIVMPGSEKNVYVPMPRRARTLLFAHSHPRGPAMFSYRDVLSAANMLSDGVFEVCVVGVNGVLCLYRVHYLTIEDFEKLIELASSVETINNLYLELSRACSVGIVRI